MDGYQQAAQGFAALDRAGGLSDFVTGLDELVAQPLVISLALTTRPWRGKSSPPRRGEREGSVGQLGCDSSSWRSSRLGGDPRGFDALTLRVFTLNSTPDVGDTAIGVCRSGPTFRPRAGYAVFNQTTIADDLAHNSVTMMRQAISDVGELSVSSSGTYTGNASIYTYSDMTVNVNVAKGTDQRSGDYYADASRSQHSGYNETGTYVHPYGKSMSWVYAHTYDLLTTATDEGQFSNPQQDGTLTTSSSSTDNPSKTVTTRWWDSIHNVWGPSSTSTSGTPTTSTPAATSGPDGLGAPPVVPDATAAPADSGGWSLLGTVWNWAKDTVNDLRPSRIGERIYGGYETLFVKDHAAVARARRDADAADLNALSMGQISADEYRQRRNARIAAGAQDMASDVGKVVNAGFAIGDGLLLGKLTVGGLKLGASLVGKGLKRIGATFAESSVVGAAGGANRSFPLNVAGPRTASEAEALARAAGIEIGSDVRIRFRPDKYFAEGVAARYGGRVSGNYWSRVRWSDIADKNGVVTVYVRRSVLRSDAEIISTLAHEMHEINALRNILGGGRSIAFGDFAALVKGGLHEEAWDVANALVDKLFGGI